ncbi:MAG TPA: hypothetical protein VIB08_00590, partial [Thermoanaerobaculia bacterium]
AGLGGGSRREVARGVGQADWAPDGKDLAIVRSAEGKIRVEFPVGRVLADWPRAIQSIRVSPRGDRIAFREANGALVLMDRSGKATRFPVPLEDFCWSAAGKEIWFTVLKRGSTEFRAISLEGRERLLTSLPGDFVLQDASRRGRLLLEQGEQLLEVVGKFPGDEGPHPYGWQDATFPTALSSDGRTLLFVEKDPGWKGGVTYKRPTDGSPAVALGEGFCRALSPDGKWVVCREEFTGGSLFLLPTGPGEKKTLRDGGLELRMADGVDWLPDGSRIVFSGNAPGRRPRIYVQDVSGGPPVPITTEGVVLRSLTKAVSPDGRLVLGLGPGGFSLYPLDGGAPRPLPGRSIEDRPIQWSADGRSIYVFREGEPEKIWLLDLASGRRRLWKEVGLPAPAPAAGPDLNSLLLTPDGESYVYTWGGWLADLWVLDGLQ